MNSFLSDMNIFLRELKANRRSLLLWCLGILLLIAGSMGKYSSIAGTGESMMEIMAQLPKSIQVIMGLDQFDLMSAVGYYGILFLYLSLMVTIHAVMIGAGIMAKEERDRTSEFLFAKPVSRVRIVTSKLCAAFVNVAVVGMVSTLSSLAFVGYFTEGEQFIGPILMLMLGMFLLQLIFMAIGSGIAAVSRNPKAAASAATGVLLAAFILYKAVDLSSSIDFLKYITPFTYFDAADILLGQGFQPLYIALAFGVMLLMFTGTYVFYRKRDLKV